ncbi:MAG TPA: hypothetical protein VGY66_35905, partial [Gemmataceae bacterium]|nr:hypothetical protein [Gemmataceae bacterium]
MRQPRDRKTFDHPPAVGAKIGSRIANRQTRQLATEAGSEGRNLQFAHRALRSFASMANTRGRELSERMERQIARMTRYYADLRAEVQEQADKVSARGEDTSKFALRRESLEREERLRIAELRQKIPCAC